MRKQQYIATVACLVAGVIDLSVYMPRIKRKETQGSRTGNCGTDPAGGTGFL